MRLEKLYLKNFRGINELTVEFEGQDNVIYGANGSGKTTVANAISWVLSGKSSTGEKDFSPKTANAHNLHHIAELTVSKDDGEIVIMKKEFYEKWTKKRGSQSASFTGHVCDLYINDLPVKTKEYESVIDELTNGHTADIEFLTVMGHFTEKMNMADRRKILFKLCGKVTDADILGKPEFKELDEMLTIHGTDNQKHDVSDFKKMSEMKRRDYNKRLDAIPESIATLESEIEKVDESEDEINARLQANREELASFQSTENGMEFIKKDVENKLSEARKEFEEKRYKAMSAYGQTEQVLMTDALHAERDLDQAKKELEWLHREHESRQKIREELLGEYEVKVKANVWDKQNEICPTCSQDLPANKIDELYNKFIEDREKTKSAINAKGKANGNEMKDLQAKIEACQKRIDELINLKASKDEALRKWQENKPSEMAFEDTDVYRELTKMLDSITDNVEHEKCEEALDCRVSELQSEIKTDEAKLVSLGIAKKLGAKIAELKVELAKVTEALEKTEKAIYLCEHFMMTKAELITTTVNDKFSLIKWKLFENQINGGLREVCEPMIPNADGNMVDYKSANTASQMNASLEIMDVLAKAYEVSLPIIIDRAESISDIRHMDCQTISLVVSPQDKVLRIEKAKE